MPLPVLLFRLRLHLDFLFESLVKPQIFVSPTLPLGCGCAATAVEKLNL